MSASAQDSILGRPLAESLQRAIQATMKDGFQINTQLEAWSVERGPIAFDPYVICTIDMKQDDTHWGAFILALSREAIKQVLTQYGISDTSNQRLIDDAAGEIANMIYGMMKTSVNKLGYRFVMEIPNHEQLPGEIADRYAATEKMVMPFLANGHRCRIVVAHDA